MTSICASPLYSNQTICAVIEALDALGVEATDTKDAALAALDALQIATTNGINAMSSINYVDGTGGINTTYAPPDDPAAVPDFSALGPTAPTFPTAPSAGTLAAVDTAPTVGSAPTVPVAPVVDDPPDVLAGPIIPVAPATPAAYVVPAATDLLITAATFDATFAREAARRTRVGVKRERDAVYRAGRLGVGKSSGALSIGLSEAEEETNLDISSTAQDKAVAEGEMLREDVKTLHGLHIQNWPLHPEIELKAYSAEEELGVEVYKAESGLGLEAYRDEGNLRLGTYTAEERAQLDSWKAEGTLELDSYKAEEGLQIDAFRAQEEAKTGGYQAIVAGLANAYDAEVKWAIGYLQAESDRYKTFLQKYQTDLAAETERRGWSQLQVQAALEEADKATKYAVEKAQYILDTSRETAQATAQIIGTLAAAIYAAQDYNLSGRGAQSVTESA